MLLLLGVFEVFEQIRIEDGGADLVVSRGPFAEVDGAAALRAEGDFGGVDGNDFLADGAVEDLGAHGMSLGADNPCFPRVLQMPEMAFRSLGEADFDRTGSRKSAG